MWGGPTPHNLVTLSLCCAVGTCSEVPITSSDRDTTEAREGRPHFLLPSVIPAQVQGRHLHNEKYPYDWVSTPHPTPPDASWDHAEDTTHFGRNELKKKDYGRIAQSNLGAVTRIGSCSLEKRQGRSKRKQCVRSDRL